MKLIRNTARYALYGTLAVAVLGSTLAVSQRGEDYKFFDPLIDVKAAISQRFVEEPDLSEMQLAAINGMIESLDDPFTTYVPPAETREFTKDLTGEYVGIGALVNIQDGWLTIVSPLEDSPAFKSGLMADDRVVEIDGKSTQGLTSDECVDLLAGEPGSSVTLTIERGAEKLPVVITRERINTRTVKGYHRDEADPMSWKFMIDGTRRIGYARITQFQQTTTQELAQALDAMGAREGTLGGLILDLRFDPGGLLTEAIGVADLFLKSGTIVSTKGRAREEEVAKAEEPGTLPDFPLVVLVNGQSASASEIVAGALADNRRATIVGTRSFGKGSVQRVIPLPRSKGAQLKVTEGFYYLPSGRCLHRKEDSTSWGVDPTPGYWVSMTPEETGEMLRLRREEEVIHTGRPNGDPVPAGGDWSDPAWIVDRLKDKQLGAALTAIQGRIDSGDWTPVGETDTSGLELVSQELTRLEGTRERMIRELTRLDKRIGNLETASNAKAAEPPPPLWPVETDLTGGTIEVRDKEGAVVARLKVTGNDVERWLSEADVEPAAEAEENPN